VERTVVTMAANVPRRMNLFFDEAPEKDADAATGVLCFTGRLSPPDDGMRRFGGN